MQGSEWAFEEFYTPVETIFLRDAERLGLAAISGYELNFYQGVHILAYFADKALEEDAFRALLAEGDTEA